MLIYKNLERLRWESILQKERTFQKSYYERDKGKTSRFCNKTDLYEAKDYSRAQQISKNLIPETLFYLYCLHVHVVSLSLSFSPSLSWAAHDGDSLMGDVEEKKRKKDLKFCAPLSL